jgi:hypothetical protein
MTKVAVHFSTSGTSYKIKPTRHYLKNSKKNSRNQYYGKYAVHKKRIFIPRLFENFSLLFKKFKTRYEDPNPLTNCQSDTQLWC